MDYIAIYAAVVATIAIGWRIYEWFRQGPQIKVKVGFLHKINVPGIDSREIFIGVTAMNKGNYPTTICTAGLKVSNNRDLQHMDSITLRQLPFRLNPGESVQVDYEPEKIKAALTKEGEGTYIKFPWFRDQADRLYKGKLTKAIRDKLRQ